MLISQLQNQGAARRYEHLGKEQPAAPSAPSDPEPSGVVRKDSDCSVGVARGRGERKGQVGKGRGRWVGPSTALPQTPTTACGFAADSFPSMFLIMTQNLLYSKIQTESIFRGRASEWGLVYGTLPRRREGAGAGLGQPPGEKQLFPRVPTSSCPPSQPGRFCSDRELPQLVLRAKGTEPRSHQSRALGRVLSRIPKPSSSQGHCTACGAMKGARREPQHALCPPPSPYKPPPRQLL